MTAPALAPSALRGGLGRGLRLTGGRVAAMGLAALALASLHLPGRPSTLCVLRAVTGIPCPLCGGTTAAVQVGRGDLLGALRASPFALLGAAAFALWPLAPRAVARWTTAHTVPLAVGVLTFAEAWQIHRLVLS
jgi:hypothetical protein